jgi:hypothetical protein
VPVHEAFGVSEVASVNNEVPDAVLNGETIHHSGPTEKTTFVVDDTPAMNMTDEAKMAANTAKAAIKTALSDEAKSEVISNGGPLTRNHMPHRPVASS